MKLRPVSVAALVVPALALAILAAAPAPKAAIDPTAKERAALAEKIYAETFDRWAMTVMAPIPTDEAKKEKFLATPIVEGRHAELLATWSVRWRDALAASSPNAAGRAAAFKAHVDRMARLESGKFSDIDLKNVANHAFEIREFFQFISFFRLEAEAALARETAR